MGAVPPAPAQAPGSLGRCLHPAAPQTLHFPAVAACLTAMTGGYWQLPLCPRYGGSYRVRREPLRPPPQRPTGTRQVPAPGGSSEWGVRAGLASVPDQHGVRPLMSLNPVPRLTLP